MGLLAGHTREPKDTDITSAYYRLLRVENHYPVVNGITTPKSTVIAEVFRDKPTRLADPNSSLSYHGVETSGVITTTTMAYDSLAADLGVANVEA